MYAEICSAACSKSKKVADRELWTRRIVQIEKCIDSVDSAVARGIPCSVSMRSNGYSTGYSNDTFVYLANVDAMVLV